MFDRLWPFRREPRAGAEANAAAEAAAIEHAKAAEKSAFDVLMALAEQELQADRREAAAAVVAIARDRAPHLTAPAHLGALTVPTDLPKDRRALFHLAQGQAHCLLGAEVASRDAFERALTFDPTLSIALDALATFRMPGDDYQTWLKRLYALLTPRTLVEIGVSDGASLALAPPDCLTIGIDPEPKHTLPLGPKMQVFAETSDAFFAARRLETILSGDPVDIGFIDGLHHFEQVLRDFINLEANCGSRSVILIHDTFPLHEIVQQRERATEFWTGDVWRILPCLTAIRPDLKVMTVATRPSGLTIVHGLDPRSTVLNDRYAEACARFGALPYAALRGNEAGMLLIAPNHWNVVEARLRALKRLRPPPANAAR